MRKVFIDALMAHAQLNPHFYLLVGDVGYSVVEPFCAAFPQRFINAGVAEQNMISVAAGLAMAGKQVVAYTIIPFLIMRSFEQIRVDICYHHLPVKLLGVSGGYGYAQAAGTHHAIEDIAIMRSLPGMTVVAPAHAKELQALMPAILAHDGPVYCRMSKVEATTPYPDNIAPTLGKIATIAPGNGVLILVSGHVLGCALRVKEILLEHGIVASITSVHTIKPFDIDYLMKQVKTFTVICTIEEHSSIGGLGDVVARTLIEHNHAISYVSIAIPDIFMHAIGSPAYLQKKAGIDADRIALRILEKLSINTSVPLSEVAL